MHNNFCSYGKKGLAVAKTSAICDHDFCSHIRPVTYYRGILGQ